MNIKTFDFDNFIDQEIKNAKENISLEWFDFQAVMELLENILRQKDYDINFINYFKKTINVDNLSDYIDNNWNYLEHTYTYWLFDFEYSLGDLGEFEFESDFIKSIFSDEYDLNNFTSLDKQYCYTLAPRLYFDFSRLIANLLDCFNNDKPFEI